MADQASSSGTGRQQNNNSDCGHTDDQKTSKRKKISASSRSKQKRADQGSGSGVQQQLDNPTGNDSNAKRCHTDAGVDFDNNTHSSTQGLKNNLHGGSFQLKILVLFLRRGLHKNYDFRLGTEVGVAAPFDDVLFRYQQTIGGNQVHCYRFMQVKHRHDQNQKITYNDFLNKSKQGVHLKKEGDFSLNKYFRGFVRIREHPEISKGHLEDFIICTNIGLDLTGMTGDQTNLSDVFEEVNSDDDILKFDSLSLNKTPKRYKFQEQYHDTIVNDMGLKAEETDDFKEFLKHLMFAVDQPGDKQLGEFLADEIGRSLHLVNSDLMASYVLQMMWDWFKDKGPVGQEGTFLSQKHGHSLIEEVKALVRSLHLVGPNLIYCSKIRNYGINFEENDEFISGIIPLLASESNPVIFAVAAHGQSQLTACKLHQVIITEYKSDDSFIFLELKDLVFIPNIVKHVFEYKKCRLLIVDCKTSSTTQQLSTLHQLQTVVDKMILIVPNPVSSHDFIQVKSLTDTFEFNDLTSSSKDHILAMPITFKGEKIILSKLLEINSKSLIDSSTLMKLVQRKPVHVGKPLKLVDKFYIERQLDVHDSNRADYTEKNLDETQAVEHVNGSTEKLVLIPTEAGSGKTTFLTHLSLILKRLSNDSIIWIVRIDLNDHTRKLQKISRQYKSDIKPDAVVQFLIDAQDLKTQFEQNLFKWAVTDISHIQVVVLLDGFDEISPHYKDVVTTMIKLLKETQIQKLWVTTRPNWKSELQDKTSIMLDLLKVSPLQQINYLTSKFSSSHSQDEKDVINKASTFAEHVLTLLEPSFVGNTFYDIFRPEFSSDLVGFPLHLEILALAFQDDFDELINFSDMFVMPKQLNILSLYQRFHAKKQKVYASEKKKLDTSNPAVDDDERTLQHVFLENHKKAALFELFQTEDLKCFFPLDVVNVQRTVEPIKRAGFIDRIIEGKPRFIHRTFAEYFAALWFSEHLESKCLKPILDDKKYYKSEYSTLGKFFDLIICENLPLHLAILNRTPVDDDFLRSHLHDEDKAGRTPLHLATYYNDLDVQSRLLFNDAQTNSVDLISNKVFEERKFMLEYQKTSGIDWKGTTKDPFQSAGVELDKYVCEGNLYELEMGFISKFDPDLIIEMGEHLIMTAIDKDHWHIVAWLTQKGAKPNEERLQILDKLYVYAVSGNLHKMTLLLQTNSPDIVNNCKCEKSLTAIQLAACNNQWDTVEYLFKNGAEVDVSPDKKYEGYTTVLHRAVISGQLDVVKMLLESGRVRNLNSRHCHSSVYHLEVNTMKWSTDGPLKFDGFTPVHIAAFKGNRDILQLLTKSGADLRSSSGYGEPIAIAAWKRHWHIVEHILMSTTDEDFINYPHSDLPHPLNGRGFTLLHVACHYGDLDIVKLLVRKYNANVNCSHESGVALLQAIELGHFHLVKYLVDECSAHVKDHNCANEVLWSAAKNVNVEIFKFLEAKGLELRAVDEGGGKSPLHEAARLGHVEMVKHIVNRKGYVPSPGVDFKTLMNEMVVKERWDIIMCLLDSDASCIDEAYEGGKALLHLAAEKGSIKGVEYLISKNANPHAVTSANETPAYMAAINGHWNVVRFLMDHDNSYINVTYHSGFTLTSVAVGQSRLEELKYLVGKNGNIHSVNIKNETLLHMASRINNLEMVKYLVENGANINAVVKDNETPAYQAANSGHWNVVRYLIGCDVSSINMTYHNAGKALIHMAAEQRCLDDLKYLISKNADIHALTCQHLTALHLASQSNNLEMVKYLVENGANVNALTNHNSTPAYLAADNGHWDVVRSLIDCDASSIDITYHDGISLLHTAAVQWRLEEIKYLISKNADINAVTNQNETALHLASKNYYLDAVKYLVEAGANVNAVTNDNETPLFIALKNRSWEIASYFLDQDGLDVNNVTTNGQTPLHCAANCHDLDLVKKLILKGANTFKVVNQSGRTPYDEAVRLDNSIISDYLAQYTTN